MKIIIFNKVLLINIFRVGGGGGYYLYKLQTVCANSKVIDFVPFHSENECTHCRFCSFWSGNRYGFQGNYSMGVYKVNIFVITFEMNQTERVMCKFGNGN